MVKSNSTSTLKLASTARSTKGHIPEDASDGLRSQFVGAALGMSWQLAVIVLLPIVGGYKLDVFMSTSPIWTLVGLVVAMAGSIFVIRRALVAFGNFDPINSQAESQAEPKTKPKTESRVDRK